MTHWKIAVVLAALPSLALPQASALDQARGANATVQAGTKVRTQAADAALADPGAAVDPAAATPDGSIDLTPAARQLEGDPVAVAPGSRDPAPASYVIQKGDTLWDLSGKFLDSPWYWPKLWSYNPQIENPHWIYPGNPLRLAPAGPEAPARIEIVVSDAAPPRELDDLTRGNLDRAERIEDDDAVTVGGPYKIGGSRPRGPAVLRNSFVTASQLEASGKVVAAFEEKSLLTTGDRIYGRFVDPAGVKVGQKFSIYRTDGRIVHPVTGRFVGWKTVILGTARVTAVEAGKATSLVITYVNDSVERGDLIGPDVDQARKPLFVRPNRGSVDGFVIGVQPAIVTGAAEFNVVYLDRGRADGVEVGNTFEVVRSGDPLFEPPDRPLNTPGLPREVIGNLVVFDAQDRASTAYVRRSLLEVLVGDHVEMRPGADAPSVKQGG
ncbi:MAG TPA: LysM peptidoglycan-binding domain-containing protein [Anaeromyxobacteraceae bacterium]|nr:LysM peptidoglycan-binding domain-containing protein [Anaeromyxobacteraceae bacterium]